MDKFEKKTLNREIPMKSVRFNKYIHKNEPWITKDILESMKTRDNIHMKFMKSTGKAKYLLDAQNKTKCRNLLAKKIKKKHSTGEI